MCNWVSTDGRGPGRQAAGEHVLFVELETALPRREQIRQIRRAFDPYQWAMDIIVYTPTESRKWQGAAASLVSAVPREGKVLYERRGSGTDANVVCQGGKRPVRRADHAR